MTFTSFLQSFWMLLHMIGLGLVFFVLCSAFFVERAVRAASDWTARRALGMMMRRIGLLSPIAGAILLISGIGNMATFGYTMSQAFGPAAAWLGVKIVLFFISLTLGGIVNARIGKKRMAIGAGVMQGGDQAAALDALRETYGTVTLFIVVQATLLFAMLVLVLFRPF